jgi:Mycothiol maleylpyruvate isomerase N-terminal domain
MTQTAADVASGERLLGQAVAYALEHVEAITPDLLARPTPCRGWDLRMLLWHCCESLAALREGLAASWVGLFPADCGCRAADPVATYAGSALRLLDCLASPARPDAR